VISGGGSLSKMYPPIEVPKSIVRPGELSKLCTTQTIARSGAPQALWAVDVKSLTALAGRSTGSLEVVD